MRLFAITALVIGVLSGCVGATPSPQRTTAPEPTTVATAEPRPEPTPQPSATPEPSPVATEEPVPEPTQSRPPVALDLPEGPHVLADRSHGPGEPPVTVTISAPGWFGEEGGRILLKNDDVDPPDGAGMIGPWFGALYVFGDPCQWSTTFPDTPVTTVDEFVTAIAGQSLRNASEPVDTTIDGYSGKSIILHVPEDAAYADGEFTDCDRGFFASWNRGPGRDVERYSQGPGQIDEVWVLDVDGLLTVIDAAYYAGTPAGHVAELRAIIESATFELP